MVKNITDYGVFVDLGGLDGLLHVSDIFWGRPSHPSRIFRLGMEIEILVLKFDREKERVSLGYKQLQTDPWLSVSNKYPPGCRVHGKVVSLTDYGAFVEIEEGVEGLVHISEMSWSKRLKSPSELLSVGDSVEVVVLDVNPEERRMALGMKQTVPDPWVIFAERHSIGQVVGGRVSHLTEFGVFVEVAPEVDGLVHISDLASFRKVQHPSELFRKGDPVSAVIVALDLENRRLSLSIHALAAAAKAGATQPPLGEGNASVGFGGDRSS
jgi:small subunit ribosomal protein S1